VATFTAKVLVEFEFEASDWNEADELLQMESSYTVPNGRVTNEETLELEEKK
jgi:hypothetical protein